MAEGKTGNGTMYLRLQIAYALEFAIWGAWSYALGTWSSAHHVAQGSLYAAFALGALFAPCVGPIADRKFAAQRVFAFMQAICGLALLACAYFASTEGVLAEKAFAKGLASDPNFSTLASPSYAWQAMMFVAGFFFLPSIPLLNAIVFKHIPNSSKTPFVFIFGTIGWIVVNWVISAMGTAGVEFFYIIDGAIALVLAVYALTLPNTPPSGAKNNDPFGFKALALFKRWDFACFVVCASLVGIFGSNYYFAFVGSCFPDKGVFNQYSELLFMAALAFAVARIGLKWCLTLGMAAWGVRYVCFASGNDPLAIVGILLHGLAYTFLYTAAYMYGDKIANKEQKASVQALICFLLLGVAQTLSGYAANYMLEKFPRHKSTENAAVVLVESAYAQDASINEAAAPAVDASAGADESIVTEEAAPVDAEPVDAGETAPVAADGAAKETPKASFGDSLKTWWDKATWDKYVWEKIWGYPAALCLIVAIFFALTGKEPKAPEEDSEAK